MRSSSACCCPASALWRLLFVAAVALSVCGGDRGGGPTLVAASSSSGHPKRRGYGSRQGTSYQPPSSSEAGDDVFLSGSPERPGAKSDGVALGNLIPASEAKPRHRHHHGGAQEQKATPVQETTSPAPGQVFTSENCTLVMAQTGSTPMMHCEVGDIGEGTVSWIRRKDYHLLTVGLATYSSDDRFFTAHVRHAQDWTLRIRHAQVKDAGLYECQVSTHPPTSLFVELQLVEAQAEILGGPDKHVKSGSSLRLTCLLRRSTEPPVYIFWYRDDRMINYDANAGVLVRHGRHSSDLEIHSAKPADSGNYSCVPSNAKPASIHVHILNGEKPAAMQHGSKGSGAPAGPGHLQKAVAWIPALVLVFFSVILVHSATIDFSVQMTTQLCIRRKHDTGSQCTS
ncbi:zwei Ig domain protein zig-8-like isoform X2 [Hetaerina americana]|uniref:zwei Ig domain protein zig-8-like isoform X2 n=1 Tax=Hetaerina americana TaxID=62018 RepID=UPI003A7F2A7A